MTGLRSGRTTFRRGIPRHRWRHLRMIRCDGVAGTGSAIGSRSGAPRRGTRIADRRRGPRALVHRARRRTWNPIQQSFPALIARAAPDDVALPPSLFSVPLPLVRAGREVTRVQQDPPGPLVPPDPADRPVLPDHPARPDPPAGGFAPSRKKEAISASCTPSLLLRLPLRGHRRLQCRCPWCS